MRCYFVSSLFKKNILQLPLICYTWDNIENLIILLFYSKSLFQYAFIICFIVSKLFLLKLVNLLQTCNHICTKIRCIYRTHKINHWNEAGGHSVQDTPFYKCSFLWPLMQNLAIFYIKTVNICPLNNIEKQQFKGIQSEVLHSGHTNIFPYIHIVFSFSYVQSSYFM